MNTKTPSYTQDSAVALNTPEGLFKTLSDNLPLGVYIVQDGRFVFVNPQFLNDIGFTEDEIIGGISLDYVHPEDREKVREDTINRLKGKKSSPYEFRVITRDGKTRTVIETMVSIQYKGKRAALGSHMDITERKQLEQALQKSRASFYNIVERSADGIVVTDQRGIVLFANKTFHSILKRKPEELLGQMFGLPLVSDEMAEIDIICKSGKSGTGEIRVVETEWEGESALLVSLHDITERKEMERDMVIKDKAIASSINAIAIADFDGSIIYVNPALLNMFGYDNDAEILGTSILEFWPNEKHSQKAIESLYEEGGWQGELVKYRKNGSRFYCQLSINPVLDYNNRFVAMMASFIDLTERKRAEETLETLNKELKAKVSELETFSYGIAHDLRSPLVSIEGFSRLLRDDMQKGKLEKVQEDIRIIESGVTKMKQLISRTLEYSRIGYLVKVRRDISFSRIVKEVLSEFHQQLHSSGAEVSVAKKFPRIYADRVRIREVLSNLIQNSINYRDKNKPLKILIGSGLVKNEVVFFVRDNGTGIDAEDKEKVFDLFYRGTSVGEGSGTGLAIVKRIIEAHGGRVWAEGGTGKGTTIYFSLRKCSNEKGGNNNGKD